MLKHKSIVRLIFAQLSKILGIENNFNSISHTVGGLYAARGTTRKVTALTRVGGQRERKKNNFNYTRLVKNPSLAEELV